VAGRGTVFDVGRARTAQAGRALLRTHCPVDEGQAQLGVAMLPVGWRVRAVTANLDVRAGRAVPCSPAPANMTHD
jgi:hypothetical protein